MARSVGRRTLSQVRAKNKEIGGFFFEKGKSRAVTLIKGRFLVTADGRLWEVQSSGRINFVSKFDSSKAAAIAGRAK